MTDVQLGAGGFTARDLRPTRRPAPPAPAAPAAPPAVDAAADTRQDTAAAQATLGDRSRQLAVTGAQVVSVLAALAAAGVLGTPLTEAAGGALAVDAALLVPAGPAVAVWWLIYGGLAAYTLRQWLPGRAADARHRATGWWAALAMVLNAAWVAAVQLDHVWVTVGVIAALGAVLVHLVARLEERPATTSAERWAVDRVFGAYLGAVLVAVAVNAVAAVSDAGLVQDPALATVLAGLALAHVVALGRAATLSLGGRWSVVLAAVWGLFWIALARLGDGLQSVPVALLALAAAGALIAGVVHERRSAGRSLVG